jgi:hypothetical protein
MLWKCTFWTSSSLTRSTNPFTQREAIGAPKSNYQRRLKIRRSFRIWSRFRDLDKGYSLTPPVG